MSQQSEYLDAALGSLDTQMTSLQNRLADDAAALADALASAQLNADDEAALVAAAARVTATADLVSTLALPTAVVDPANSDTAAALPVEDVAPVDDAAGQTI